MRGQWQWGVAAALLLTASGAPAHVLDKTADKAAFTLRADVAKQVSKYVFCQVKAAVKCEKQGADGAPECDLATGTVAYDLPADKATAQFGAAIAKCDAKLNLTRKGTDYAGIGCPGDCDDGAAGVQACAGLPELADTVRASTKGQLGLLTAAIAGACANEQACVDRNIKALTRYARGLYKCTQKCELDEKGKKGGGALTNAALCRADGAPAAGFSACRDTVIAKVGAFDPAAVGLVIAPLLEGVIADSVSELFNREDASDPATPDGALSPCGTCGNGAREGIEACDGADLGACDACDADCTCAPAPPPPVDPILDGPPGTFCETSLSGATTDYQALCVPTAGSGRHVRIEGAQTFGNNGFFYLAMGFPETPTGNPSIAAGDGRFIFTGGKSQSCGYAWSYFRYSGITDPPVASLCTLPSIFGAYPDGPQTVCVDVTGDTPPRVTFWATGANGADCKDAATLTVATALYSKDDWGSDDNQPLNQTTHFVKLSNTSLATFSSAAVSSNTVLP